jgi:NTP pyrophosphatase (non-canonical NTP hydrolase)
LCEQCLETVQTEIGKNLFYLTALCNLLEISLPEVMEKESKKLTTLGVFNLR